MQVDLGHAELVDQVVHRDAAEIDLALVLRGEIAPVALGASRVSRSRIAVLGLVLAVEHQRDVVQQRHLRREVLLPEHEGLERMEQVLDRKPRQQPVRAAVRRVQVVVEAGVDPGLEILPAPVGVDVRRPGHRQRMHAVLVLEHVRGIEAVLAAGAGHEAVVVPVVAAIPVAQLAAACRSRSSQSIVLCFSSATRQASQTPSSSKWMVALRLSLVCVNSTAELGRWLEITQLCAELDVLRQAVVGLGIVRRRRVVASCRLERDGDTCPCSSCCP